MIKVFENFDFSRVGQVQSLLESNGIATFVKNQFGSSVMGEVPFVEVCPQLFILNERDLIKAQGLLQEISPVEESGEPWLCSQCQSEIESQFEQCWNCGLEKSKSLIMA
jgi:hypothetical protein